MKPKIKYGLILGGIMIAIPLIYFALGLEKNDAVQKVSGYLNMVIAATVIYLGIKEQRNQFGNGFISFGTGFSTGMVISVIGSAMSAVFTYFYFTIINPGMVTYIQMKQEEEMINRGMSEADVANMADKLAFWMTPSMMTAMAFLVMILLGLVISLICGAILKKEDPSAEIS